MRTDYLLLRQHAAKRQAYEEYIREIVGLFHTDVSAAEVEIRTMIELEISLAKVGKSLFIGVIVHCDDFVFDEAMLHPWLV